MAVDGEETIYHTFDKADDFFTRLDTFLSLDISQDPANNEEREREYFACVKMQVIVRQQLMYPHRVQPLIRSLLLAGRIPGAVIPA